MSKVRALSQGLAAHGLVSTVLTANYGAARGRVAPAAIEVDGVSVRYLRRAASHRWTPLAPAAFGALPSQVDIVHILGLRDPLTSAVAARCQSRRVPYVVEPLGMLRPVVRKIRTKQLVDKVLTRRVLQLARGVVVTSLAEADDVAAFDSSLRVWIRPNPLLELPAARTPPKSVKRLIVVGRISRKKRVELAISVAATMQLPLTIVGPDDGDGTLTLLKRMIRDLEIEHLVRFAGARWGQELFELIMAHDLLLCPSVNENFGQVVVEAAALGVPVVVSRSVGASELVERLNCGIVVADPTVQKIVDAVSAISQADLTAWSSHGPMVRDLLGAERLGSEQAKIYRQALT